MTKRRLTSYIQYTIGIIIVIAVSLMVLDTQAIMDREYTDYCNDKYGVGYWHTEVNGTVGLGLKYSCFYNNSVVGVLK